MSILKPLALDAGLARSIQQGDTVAGAEVIPATIATNAITITGAQLGSGIIQRTTTGAGTDTIDSAANIISAISGGAGLNAIQNGTTWRCKWIQNAAFAITVQATANTGVTVTSGTVNASSVKDFLVTVVNGTPASSVQATTVSGSAVISGLTAAQCAAITVGMIVTNAVANLQGQTVIAVNGGSGTVTLSGNANATNTNPVTVNFSPVITVAGIGQGLL